MKTNRTHSTFIILFAIFLCAEMYAQQTIPLWDSKIPNSIKVKGYEEKPEYENGILKSTSQVSNPTLTIFIPKKENANGTAVLIFPGGGYSHLAINKEGFKVAEWLNTLGITAFVLKYRLPNDLIMKNKTIGPLQDAQEAMRYIRSNAKKWNLDENKIGNIGFSAGGHLAATLATHYDDNVYESKYKISAKPNFSLLLYPVISMKEGVSHMGSRIKLLGNSPSAELINSYSGELQVTKDTPPTFLIHATDDNAVPVENSINYYLALKQNKIPAEMHIYEKGGHGFGLGVSDTSLFWTKTCENWLQNNHFLK